MSLKKIIQGVPSDALTVGYLCQDWEALTTCQRESSKRFATTIQIEQEAYLSQHPEVKAMLEVFVSKMVRHNIRKDIMKVAAEHFTRPVEELEMEIRERLSLPPSGPYVKLGHSQFTYEDKDLEMDLRYIRSKHHHTPSQKLMHTSGSTSDTKSSSFLSIITSDTTLPTPEPIPIPEPTLSQTMLAFVSNAMDKAVFFHVDDFLLYYDTAYVELVKAVEEAMEFTVIEIKKDIANLLYNAYKIFELRIMEKERIAAELAWEKRMRKKVKKTLRLANNFKGYESSKKLNSEGSSNESYEMSKPCVCTPQFNYNRYPKDRFGIYLRREEKISDVNITATPAISQGSIASSDSGNIDAKLFTSKNSIQSKKSIILEKLNRE